MLHVYEFEVFQDGGVFLAFPYDMEGGTQGHDYREVCENAADWLKGEIERLAMRGMDLPKPTFGSDPQNGGSNLVVAVDAGKETIPRITMAEAARRLGVTRGRVSQMVASGRLETFDVSGRTWVSEASVEARIEKAPKSGRPKRVRMVEIRARFVLRKSVEAIQMFSLQNEE